MDSETLAAIEASFCVIFLSLRHRFKASFSCMVYTPKKVLTPNKLCVSIKTPSILGKKEREET